VVGESSGGLVGGSLAFGGRGCGMGGRGDEVVFGACGRGGVGWWSGKAAAMRPESRIFQVVDPRMSVTDHTDRASL
jgi:hypothetical protein